ncbi:hypothetical protein ACFLR1_00095 [Bacteroidota bacterium]
MAAILFEEFIPNYGEIDILIRRVFFAARESFTYGAIVMATLLVGVYIVGHIIAMISHLIFDKFFVQGIMGYPIKRLLLPEKRIKHKTANSIIFILFQFYFLIVFMFSFQAYLNPFYDLELNYFHWFISDTEPSSVDKDAFFLFTKCILYLIGGVFILRLIFKIFLSYKKAKYSESIEDYKKNPTIGRVYNWFRMATIKKWAMFVQINILDKLIGVVDWFAQTEHSVSNNIVEGVKNYIIKKYGEETIYSASNDSYWLSFFELYNKSPMSSAPLVNWLHLYGFVRNTSTALYMLSFYYLHEIFTRTPASITPNPHDLLMLSVCSSAGFLLFIRYWSLYKGYYSKNQLRLYYAVVVKSDN